MVGNIKVSFSQGFKQFYTNNLGNSLLTIYGILLEIYGILSTIYVISYQQIKHSDVNNLSNLLSTICVTSN